MTGTRPTAATTRSKINLSQVALTLEQATTVIGAATGSALYAYIVLSLLIGARTEELRALRWHHVDLDGRVPAKWRSDRLMAWRVVGRVEREAGTASKIMLVSKPMIVTEDRACAAIIPDLSRPGAARS